MNSSSNLCVSGMVVLVMANGVGLRSERADSQTCVGKNAAVRGNFFLPDFWHSCGLFISPMGFSAPCYLQIYFQGPKSWSLKSRPIMRLHRILETCWDLVCLYHALLTLQTRRLDDLRRVKRPITHEQLQAALETFASVNWAEMGALLLAQVIIGERWWKMVKAWPPISDYWKTIGFIEAPPYDKSITIYNYNISLWDAAAFLCFYYDLM